MRTRSIFFDAVIGVLSLPDRLKTFKRRHKRSPPLVYGKQTVVFQVPDMVGCGGYVQVFGDLLVRWGISG